LPELQTLFGEGKLAFLFNTGTLVYPITRAQYLSGSTATPPQLFSHADQQTQWQTSIPDQPPLTGWGGRCADLLNAVQPNAPISLMVTLAGANTFEIGNIVSQYSVSTSGAISLSLPGTPSGGAAPTGCRLDEHPRPALHEPAIPGLRGRGRAGHQHQQLLNNAIARHANHYWTTLSRRKSPRPKAGAPSLQPESATQMVARLIAAGSTAVASGGFGMKRQIFFCQVGGYDLHTGQTDYSANTPTTCCSARTPTCWRN
jgi:uncharacterized protein (DUF1501 family)